MECRAAGFPRDATRLRACNLQPVHATLPLACACAVALLVTQQLPPVKLHCSMLAEDAIKAAVKDLKTKQEQAKAAQNATA